MFWPGFYSSEVLSIVLNTTKGKSFPQYKDFFLHWFVTSNSGCANCEIFKKIISLKFSLGLLECNSDILGENFPLKVRKLFSWSPIKYKNSEFFLQFFPQYVPLDTYDAVLTTLLKMFVEIQFWIYQFLLYQLYLMSWQRASWHPRIPVFIEVFNSFIFESFLTHCQWKILMRLLSIFVPLKAPKVLFKSLSSTQISTNFANSACMQLDSVLQFSFFYMDHSPIHHIRWLRAGILPSSV